MMPIDPEVYVHGTLVLVTPNIASDLLDAWVRKVAATSGQRVDWHWVGGRGNIMALGDMDRVKTALHYHIAEYNQMIGL